MLRVMIRIFASFLVIALLRSSPAMANDNAGVFFYGSPPSPAQVAGIAAGANVTTTTDGNNTSIVLKWPDIVVTITINSAWNREVQLAGLRGLLSQFPEGERKAEPLASFLAELDRTTTAYGSIISPGYDKAGKVATLFKQLLDSSGGYFFSHQSFYNASGVRIAGLRDDDPLTLGPK